MLDAIRRSVAFIAWGNFTDAGVLALWARSMVLLAGVAWILLATGTLLDDRREPRTATDTLVVNLAVGLALWMPALFALAALHVYRPLAICAVAALILLAPIARDRSPSVLLEPGRRLLAACREEPWLWLLFVACSLSALLPPYRWDETAYHLAQAEQWIRAGRLTVDPTLRYPVTACNWQLLQGVAVMLRSESLVHLLTWLSGVLASLCVSLCLQRLGVGASIRYPTTIAFFVTPMVQRLLTVGLIDVPLMYALVAGVYALFRLRDSVRVAPATAVGAACVAGAFVGMKITAILFVPLFLFLAWYRLRDRLRWLYVAIFLLTAAPWYVRSAALVGDPVAPMLGRLTHTESPYWSDWDRETLATQLHYRLSWTPVALLALPIRVLSSSQATVLLGSPLLGYALVFPFSLLTFVRLRRARALECLVAAWYGVAVWLATTYHLRYATFLPLAVTAAGYTVWLMLETFPVRRAWLRTVVAVGLLIGPTPNAFRYIKSDWATRIPVEAVVDPCLGDLRALDATMAPGARVYLAGMGFFKYALELRGYRPIGDDFHPGRYGDFWAAIDQQQAGVFLSGLPADYVLLCRRHPDDRSQLWYTTLATLDADPMLHRIMEDSIRAEFQVTR